MPGEYFVAPYMSERDVVLGLVNDQRCVAQSYAAAVTESTCPAVRQTLESLLHDALECQASLQRLMQRLGWYPNQSFASSADVAAAQQLGQYRLVESGQMIRQAGLATVPPAQSRLNEVSASPYAGYTPTSPAMVNPTSPTGTFPQQSGAASSTAGHTPITAAASVLQTDFHAQGQTSSPGRERGLATRQGMPMESASMTTSAGLSGSALTPRTSGTTAAGAASGASAPRSTGTPNTPSTGSTAGSTPSSWSEVGLNQTPGLPKETAMTQAITEARDAAQAIHGSPSSHSAQSVHDAQALSSRSATQRRRRTPTHPSMH